MNTNSTPESKNILQKPLYKVVENITLFLFFLTIFVSLGLLDYNKFFPDAPKLNVTGKTEKTIVRVPELPVWLLIIDLFLFSLVLILSLIHLKQTNKVGRGIFIAVIGFIIQILFWIILGWQFGTISVVR